MLIQRLGQLLERMVLAEILSKGSLSVRCKKVYLQVQDMMAWSGCGMYEYQAALLGLVEEARRWLIAGLGRKVLISPGISVDVRRGIVSDTMPSLSLEATERIGRTKDLYYNLSFSNSGREVFATTDRGPVKIFDYPSMDHIHTLAGHPATTYTAKHAPSGAYIAVGSADSTISIWDTVNFLCTHTLNAQNQFTSIKDLSFSFDGQFLVAGSGDAARDGVAGLNIFCVETGECAHTIETANCPTYVAWHPTRYLLAYGGDPGGLRTVGLGGVVVLGS